MSHTVITHIGVSALSSKALRSVQSQNYDTILDELALGTERPDALMIAKRDLLRGLGRQWNRSLKPEQQRAVSPAEIAALSLLKTEQQPNGEPPLPLDRLVLLTSETRGGEFCAELLEHVFHDSDGDIKPNDAYPHMPTGQIQSRKIEGLAITDERVPDPESKQQKFVRKGLANYVAEVFAAYNDLKAGDTLTLNITSGYKGLVPTARDLALLLASRTGGPTIRLVYLYQSSSELVWYDTLPMSFDWSDIPAQLLMQAGEKNGATDGLPDSRHAYLFEHKEPKRLKRSAIGEVVWRLYTLLYPGIIDVPHADLS